jgi:aminopeptidase YwaD
MKFRYTLLLCWVALANLQAQKPDKLREATIHNFKKDIEYLASDELQGRLTGWPGEAQSAKYIAEEFARLKLQPAGDEGTWFQKFDIVKLRLAAGKTTMHATLDDQVHTFPLNKEFYPLSFSANQATVDAPLVFLGFGIIADSLGHNDYQGKEVKGKIAVIRLGAPVKEGKDPKSFREHATMEKKLQLAVKAGAVGIIFIPEMGAQEHPSGELKRDAAMLQIPVVYALAYTDFLEHATKASIQVDITVLTGPGHNVLGYKQNKKAKYTVVIGAHHDHLGFGELGGSRAPGVNEIHNGADDNASGTAAMLQLARYISTNKKLKKYNYLFMAFSGEELARQ